MGDSHGFVSPSGSEIFDALGVSVFFVVSDMPWSFRASAGGGETVEVYVTEHPDTVDVDVRVRTDGVVTFAGSRHGARRLEVSSRAPEIVIESGSGATIGRMEISLHPRLVINDTVGLADD